MKQEREIIAALKQRHGTGFVAKTILNQEEHRIGDEWVNWGSVSIIRAIYNYMKNLFQSFTAYSSRISWQNIMNYVDGKSMPVFQFLEIVNDLDEMVSDAANELGCKFIDSAVELFDYLFGIVKNSEEITQTDRKTLSNVNELKEEIKSCGSFLSQLGKKAIEFIQWIARKMKAAITYITESVYEIFTWLGDTVSSIALNTYNGVSSAAKNTGKTALSLGVFTVAMAREIGSEGIEKLTKTKEKLRSIGSLLIDRFTIFFNALFSSTKKSSVLSDIISSVLRTTGALVSYAGGEERFVKIMDGFNTVLEFTLSTLARALSWIRYIKRLPGMVVEKILAAILKPLIAPVSRWIASKLGDSEGDKKSELEETLAAAENLYANHSSPEFLRRTIDEARETQREYEEALKENEKTMPWRQRIDSAWTLSDAAVQSISGGELTQKHRNALARTFGPTTAVINRLALMTPKLQTAMATATLKSVRSVTTLEDDEEFAQLWSQKRPRIELASEEDLHLLRIKWLQRRDAVLSASAKNGESKDILEQHEKYYANTLKSLEAITARKLEIEVAKEEAWKTFRWILVGLGLGAVLYIMYSKYEANEQLKADNIQRRNLYDQSVEEKGTTAFTDSLSVDLTGKSLTTSNLATGLDTELSTAIINLSDTEARSLFVTQAANLRTSKNAEVKRKANRYFDQLKKSGEVEERTVILERGIFLHTKSQEAFVNPAAEASKASAVEGANLRDVMLLQANSDISARNTGFEAWEKGEYGANIASQIISSMLAPFFVDTSSINALFAQLLNSFSGGVGAGFQFASAMWTIFAWVIVPLVAILLLLALIYAAVMMYKGVGAKDTLLKLTTHVTMITSLLKLFDELAMFLYGMLSEKVEIVSDEYRKLSEETMGTLGKLASTASTLLSFLDGSWMINLVQTASGAIAWLVTAPFKTSGNTTKYEEMKTSLDAFDIGEIVDISAPTDFSKPTVPTSAPQRAECAICTEISHSMCGDCATVTYCSTNCADIDWPMHTLFCSS